MRDINGKLVSSTEMSSAPVAVIYTWATYNYDSQDMQRELKSRQKFGTAAGGQLTGEEKNGKEKAAIQTSGGVSDAVEPKKIALTFDDGPHPVYTKILLDGLAERGAKASFFVTGENAEKYPELILRMQKEGHLIGNHTYSHIQLTSNNRESSSNRCSLQSLL